MDIICKRLDNCHESDKYRVNGTHLNRNNSCQLWILIRPSAPLRAEIEQNTVGVECFREC
jgi:hypothetical protein